MITSSNKHQSQVKDVIILFAITIAIQICVTSAQQQITIPGVGVGSFAVATAPTDGTINGITLNYVSGEWRWCGDNSQASCRGRFGFNRPNDQQWVAVIVTNNNNVVMFPAAGTQGWDGSFNSFGTYGLAQYPNNAATVSQFILDGPSYTVVAGQEFRFFNAENYADATVSDNRGAVTVQVVFDYAPGSQSPSRSFFVTHEKGNYASVKQQCINQGGSIASIRSAAEDAQANALCVALPGDLPCAIGLTNSAKEGTWRWDDNSAFSYNNFDVSQPDNAHGGQDCGIINWGVRKKWDDQSCTSTSYYGICQTSATIEQYTCPPGTYDKSPPTEPGCVCEECPAGHYCEGGDAGKEECHKGYFQPLKGQSACEPSPKGHKVPDTGAEHPTACPPGEYQNLEAQDSCKRCLKGNYCPGTGNENPTKCEGGKYQDERGKDSCDDCPKGNKCPGTGNEQPTKCWNGQYQNEEGKEICKDCPIGNKCAGEGNENPTECGANTFQPCTGQEKCIPCEVPLTSGVGQDSCGTPRRRNTGGKKTEASATPSL